MTEPMKNPFDDSRRLAVTDCRETVGFVARDHDGIFIALDAAGQVVGRFDTCLAASRAINPKSTHNG
jgi:hypothetical protein